MVSTRKTFLVQGKESPSIKPYRIEEITTSCNLLEEGQKVYVGKEERDVRRSGYCLEEEIGRSWL